jgi:uncharacterized protein YgiM (DUF1202 family)
MRILDTSVESFQLRCVFGYGIKLAVGVGMLKRALTLLVLPLTLLAAGCEATVDEETADDSMASTADAITSSAAGEALVTTTGVRFREGPGTSYGVIRTLSSGTEATSLGGAQGGFIKVKVGNAEGWVHGNYLVKKGSAQGQPSTGGSGGQSISGQTLLWQGNWDFLVKCDSYSRRLNRVTYSCPESDQPGGWSKEFVNNGYWIAVPSTRFKRSLCGETARVCKGGTCVNATIVERSVTDGRWEGSTAVLKAMGVSPGWTGSCTSSFGTATVVTITL